MRIRSLARTLFPVALAAALAAFSGCVRLSDLSELERLFPAEAMTGAVPRATVRDLVEGKAGKGREITANAVITDSPRAEQIRPTAVTILRRLKEKYPDAGSIDVSIYDDERALSLGLTVARAKYRSGSVTITGGQPAEAEMGVVNSKREKGDRRGPFDQPREEDFNIAHKVLEFGEGTPPNEAIPGISPAAGRSDAEVEKKVAAFFRIPVERVRTARFNVSTWYGMHRETVLYEKK